MQISYQTQPQAVKSTIVTLTPNIIPSGFGSTAAAQKFYNKDLATVKSENENYNFKTVYSPFLAPSNVVVSERIVTSKAVELKFVHNEARTKYFFVSTPAKTTDHLKINLLA